MSILKTEKVDFGTLYNGKKASLYTVSNGKMSFSASDFGCTITNILLPSKNGQVDILLGRSTLEGYCSSNSCYGTIVGRFANRIGNACFTLDGVEYKLDKNDGENCLHGGFTRYEKQLWDSKEITTENGTGIEFTRRSPDGEQGMPGNVDLRVIYTLNDANELVLEYFATTDKATPVNLTNHAYFNLKGHDAGQIYDQEFQISGSKFVHVSEDLIPTGKLSSVDDEKAFDFRQPKLFGQDIAKTGLGYDHAYCVDGYDGTLRKFAVLKDPASGRTMEVSTNLPACQVYTGNFCGGVMGKGGFIHRNHDAVCLETEAYPDAPNHAEFPSCILRPGETYHAVTVYKFGF